MGRISDEQMAEAIDVIQSALAPGLAIGERGRVQMYDRALEAIHGGEFLPYPTIDRRGRRLRLCLVTQTLPPAVAGGIGRYCLDLGRELARRGHDVRIITDSPAHSTVDFEDGVWVHRIAKSSGRSTADPDAVVPPSIWANTAAVADEVIRIQGEGPLDLVYAPIWDVEGFALGEATSVLTITALMTTMGISLQNRAWSEDTEFMAALGTPIHELERRLLTRSHGLHAISSAIVGEIETASAVTIDDGGLFTSHLGVVDSGVPDGDRGSGGGVTVLFVGRFERRKGIDLLFEAIPPVLEAHPDARFELIGRDDLLDENGMTYRGGSRRHTSAPRGGTV
ncbi:MAG: glycosyltransferase [Microthrixaceae bacterium]